MKRKVLVVVLVSSMIVTTNTAYASLAREIKREKVVAAEEEEIEPDYSLLEQYQTVLKPTAKADAQELSLKEAVEKTLKNSTELKRANADLTESDKEGDKIATAFRGSGSDDNFSSLLSLLQHQNSQSNSELNYDITKETLEFSMKQAYITALNTEREITLAQMSLDNEMQQLIITRTKAKLGMVSEQELSDAELNYEKNKSALETKKTDLAATYRSLRTLMGEKDEENYSLSLPLVYEKVELPVDIDTYAKNMVANDKNIKKKENDLKLAKDRLDIYSPSNGAGSYQATLNNYNSASMDLSDAKTSLATKIKECYDSILTLETNYETNIKQLESLKSKLETIEKKLELGLATQIEYDQAVYEIAAMENTIVEQLYQHMVSMDQLKNSSLL